MTGSRLLRVSCLVFLLAGCSRSPISFSKQVSGLAIPSGARVDHFLDEPTGMLRQDLTAEASLTLTPAETIDLVAEARLEGYVRIEGELLAMLVEADSANRHGISEHGWSEARQALSSGGVGFWKYQQDTSSYSFALIDSTTNRIIVRVVIL